MGHTIRIAMAMEHTDRIAMGTEQPLMDGTTEQPLMDTAAIDRGSEPAMAHIGRGLGTDMRTSRGGRAESDRSVGSDRPS